jgi:hypothetical protein
VAGVIIMPQKFILEITLGNEGMKSDADIADVLRECAHTIEYDGIHYKPAKQIRDMNGNLVGHYEVI